MIFEKCHDQIKIISSLCNLYSTIFVIVMSLIFYIFHSAEAWILLSWWRV